ncbi:hypothetical protein HZH68_009242 [Vespula germanica]|uniref:Uncharacterized protein n=1 Tax=Vespula germanica TaxID=30212 RepID=A0A834N3R3_VESGE|nr:hypothetical protein HZH68_009242 [Vespula germanica]
MPEAPTPANVPSSCEIMRELIENKFAQACDFSKDPGKDVNDNEEQKTMISIEKKFLLIGVDHENGSDASSRQ